MAADGVELGASAGDPVGVCGGAGDDLADGDARCVGAGLHERAETEEVLCLGEVFLLGDLEEFHRKAILLGTVGGVANDPVKGAAVDAGMNVNINAYIQA